MFPSVVAIAAALVLLGWSQAATPPPGAPPPVLPSPAVLSPDEIYLKAVREMRALSKKGDPPYLVYDLEIVSHNLHWYPTTEHGLTSWDTKLVHANETSNYRVWYRSKDQQALVQDAATHAIYKGDVPFAPEASTFTSDKPRASPSASPSPTPSPNAAAAISGSDKVIGAISVSASRDYEIRLVGIENRAGHSVYHLHLRAYRDVFDNPLTDLWIDTGDYRIWAAHGEVTVRAVAAALGVGIDATFAPVGDYFVLSGIDFTGKGYMFMWHANVATTMRTSIISAPLSLPSDLFPPPSPTPTGSSSGKQ